MLLLYGLVLTLSISFKVPYNRHPLDVKQEPIIWIWASIH